MESLKCIKCWSDLDTTYICRVCGHDNHPIRITTSNNTSTCTMGNGWCPIHGNVCPVSHDAFFNV